LVAERTEKLRETNQELQKHKEQLEVLVSERTKELQDSLNELKLAQSRLIESEKMAALGSLVAGVAHEISTPVGIGVTIASHLEGRTGDIRQKYENDSMTAEAFEEFLGTAKESSDMLKLNMDRAAALITSFKQVAVDQSSEERRQFNIKKYIDEILISIRSEYKRSGHGIYVNCPENIKAFSYPGSLAQILTNLLMNSFRHAFPDDTRGEITIDVQVEEGIILLTYRDNGIGIPPENMKKIYEPFFTTNRSGGGSGLGLNIVYNQVTQNLQGHIECRSTPGEGTVFLIDFPQELDSPLGSP
ncbi:MAG: hypothetical protein F6K39_48715, partial [Okeania sp. SIO3B3]|nr:hypothetical protein [Okeania sp. SIO3B3]